VNTGKTMSCHQNAEKKHNLLIANKLFENVAKFVHDEIKNRLNSCNACYYSTQSL